VIEAQFEARGASMIDIVATTRETLEGFFGDLTGVTVSYDARPEVYNAEGVVRWVADVTATKAAS